MRNRDEMDQNLRQVQKSQQPDKMVYKIKRNDVEIIVGEKDTKIVWEEDPTTPGLMMPRIVTEITYNLDSEGLPFGEATDVGVCSFGCSVRRDTLLQCNHCHESICRKHTITVGQRKYCRKRPCNVVARSLQVFGFIYCIIRFFFLSVTGLYTDEDRRPRRNVLGIFREED